MFDMLCHWNSSVTFTVLFQQCSSQGCQVGRFINLLFSCPNSPWFYSISFSYIFFISAAVHDVCGQYSPVLQLSERCDTDALETILQCQDRRINSLKVYLEILRYCYLLVAHHVHKHPQPGDSTTAQAFCRRSTSGNVKRQPVAAASFCLKPEVRATFCFPFPPSTMSGSRMQ